MPGSLSPIQDRVLRLLARLEPRWTLTGGAALAGFHLAHRRTKDVDLFFHGLAALGRLPEDAAAALGADGMSVTFLQRAPAFCRLRAEVDGEVVLVDLVAEPVANLFPSETHVVDSIPILVDTRTEILVNKLGALYSRSEVRDLVDVKSLVDAGEDLSAALALVVRKDGGFSPADLAWVLRTLNVAALARADGYDSAALTAFRDHLIDRLLA